MAIVASLSANKRHQSFLMPFLFVSSLGRADFADCHEIDNHVEDVKIRQLYTIDPIANDSPPLKGRGRGWGLCCPLSPFISLPPSLSLYILSHNHRPHPFPLPCRGGEPTIADRREKQLSTRHFTEYNP